MSVAVLPAPLPGAALDLLARSDLELAASQVASDPEGRFLHGHLGALRAAAAVLAVTGRPGRRGGTRTVWDMVATAAPALAGWAAYFAAGAPLRAAVESGRSAVTADQAEATARAAEDFQDAVRAYLGRDVGSPGGLRAG